MITYEDTNTMLHVSYHNKVRVIWVLHPYFFLTMAIKNKTRIARVIPKKIMSVYGVSNSLTASSK